MTTTTPTSTPSDAALSAHPGATAAGLAEVAGIGRSTAARCLAALEQAGTARRTPGGREGGRHLPDRRHLAVADTPGTPPAGDGPDGAPAGRLGKGALRDLVLAYLAAHAERDPDGDGLGPTAIAKGLGAGPRARSQTSSSASKKRARSAWSRPSPGATAPWAAEPAAAGAATARLMWNGVSTSRADLVRSGFWARRTGGSMPEWT